MKCHTLIMSAFLMSGCGNESTLEQKVESINQKQATMSTKPLHFSIDEMSPETAESYAQAHNVPVTIEDPNPDCPYSITYLPNGMEEGNGKCY